ncbi:MAG: hypothetical protein RLZZ174_1825 [Pseudomonadota bacterium]
MSGQAAQPSLETFPLVLSALRDALQGLAQGEAPEPLLRRVDALARLLCEAPTSAPPGLRLLADHLGNFGAFLLRSVREPATLAALAEPAAELCVAWAISNEALYAGSLASCRAPSLRRAHL